MSMIPVALFYLERDENPGFEATCDVFAGFGATADEALTNLAAAIEAGPPKPAAPEGPLTEAPASTGGATLDYDKLADALFARLQGDASKAGETVAAAPAAPAEATVTTTEPAAPAAS